MEERKVFIDIYTVNMKHNLMLNIYAERYEIEKNVFDEESDIIYFYIDNTVVAAILKKDIKNITKW